jgi:hypothetical protein
LSESKQTQTLVHVDPLAVGIVVLAVATALIHLVLGISLGPPSARPFPLLFYLNTLGYLVLVTALFVPQLRAIRREVRWVFIAYTITTIVMWFLLAPERILLGYSDKVIETVLVILLIVDDLRSARGIGMKRTR